MNIILVGNPCTGKSTIAPILAKMLGYGAIDTDALLSKRQKKSIDAIFLQHGEGHFRKLETALLHDLAEIKNSVVATGGGMPCYDNNWKLLSKLGSTVWLNAEIECICQRFMRDSEKLKANPVLNPVLAASNNEEILLKLVSKVRELNDARGATFRRADFVINSSFATPEFCASMIKKTIVLF